MTNYAKNDASIIYKSLRESGYRFLETIALQATSRQCLQNPTNLIL